MFILKFFTTVTELNSLIPKTRGRKKKWPGIYTVCKCVNCLIPLCGLGMYEAKHSCPAYPAMVRLLFSLSSSWESRVSVSWVAMATTRDPLRPSCSNFAIGDTSSLSSTLVDEVDTITEFKSVCSKRIREAGILVCSISRIFVRLFFRSSLLY